MLAFLENVWPEKWPETLDNNFFAGFWTGVALCAVLLLVYLIVRSIIRMKHGCRGITMVSDDGEELCISRNAFQEFVTRIVYEYGEASLLNFSMDEKRDTVALWLKIGVLPDPQVPVLKEQLSERIKNDAGEKLGVDRPIKVHIAVENLSASERKIAKASRRAGAPAAGPPPQNEDRAETDYGPLPLDDDDEK